MSDHFFVGDRVRPRQGSELRHAGASLASRFSRDSMATPLWCAVAEAGSE